MKPRHITLLALGLSAICSALWSIGSDPQPAFGGGVPAPLPQQAPRYLGASTCSGMQCHGRSEVGDRLRARQVEFTIWSQQDKHRQAYATLGNELSQAMAQHLRLDKPPQESAACLNCHSLNVIEPARRGADFRLSDGVSCDGCHGPAELWFGPHLNEPYADSVRRGMKDIRNPAVRAEVCLSCHLGNRAEGKVVNHELLAAGHPPLDFETAADSLKMPPHWREANPSATNLPHAQLWAVGQLASLRQALQLLVDNLEAGPWPEYEHFDCTACHHDLTSKDWRKSRPTRRSPTGAGRPAPGRPIWMVGNYLPSLRLLDSTPFAVGPSKDIPDRLGRLQLVFSSRPFGDKSKLAPIAAELAGQLDEMVEALAQRDFSPQQAKELAGALTQAVEEDAWYGPDTARQLVLALDALSHHNPNFPQSSKSAIRGLREELAEVKTSNGYDPAWFIERIRPITKELR